MNSDIRVLGVPERDLETKSIFKGEEILEIGMVKTDILKSNLKGLAERLAHIFSTIETDRGFGLKQATIGVEISSSGGVTLIGSLKAGAKASVTLTFERRE